MKERKHFSDVYRDMHGTMVPVEGDAFTSPEEPYDVYDITDVLAVLSQVVRGVPVATEDAERAYAIVRAMAKKSLGV